MFNLLQSETVLNLYDCRGSYLIPTNRSECDGKLNLRYMLKGSLVVDHTDFYNPTLELTPKHENNETQKFDQLLNVLASVDNDF